MAVYRNRETMARIRRMIAMIAIAILAVGVVGVLRAAGGQGSEYTPWAGVALTMSGLIAVALIARLGHVSIETDGEGIVVRNLLSTRRLAWSEIDGFEEGPRRRGFTTAAVRTRSGRRHALAAVGDPGARSAEMLERLRGELDAARSR